MMMRKTNTERDIILKWQNWTKVMQKWKSRDSRRKKQRWGLLFHVAAAPEWKLLVSGPSACPSSFMTNEEPGSCSRRGEGGKVWGEERSGFYLLRLTGRLSLFLRRQVLRWYCVCVWACVCPRLARTGLLTSGGLWKPFTLNLTPFWGRVERREGEEKKKKINKTFFVNEKSNYFYLGQII